MNSASVLKVLNLDIITFARETMIEPDYMVLSGIGGVRGGIQTIQTNHHHQENTTVPVL